MVMLHASDLPWEATESDDLRDIGLITDEALGALSLYHPHIHVSSRYTFLIFQSILDLGTIRPGASCSSSFMQVNDSEGILCA